MIVDKIECGTAENNPLTNTKYITATAPTTAAKTSTALGDRLVTVVGVADFSEARSCGEPNFVSIPMRGRYWKGNVVGSPMPPTALLKIM